MQPRDAAMLWRRAWAEFVAHEIPVYFLVIPIPPGHIERKERISPRCNPETCIRDDYCAVFTFRAPPLDFVDVVLVDTWPTGDADDCEAAPASSKGS
jgi:hypothetical protein